MLRCSRLPLGVEMVPGKSVRAAGCGHPARKRPPGATTRRRLGEVPQLLSEAERIRITPDVVRMYVTDRRSLLTIGRRYRRDPHTIRGILVRAGVTIRPSHSTPGVRTPAAVRAHYKLRKRIRKLYVEKHSIRQIAAQCNVSYRCVRDHLVAAGITLRPRGRHSESRGEVPVKRPCQLCEGGRSNPSCTICGGSGSWNDGEAGKGNKNNPMPPGQPGPRNPNRT